MKHKPTYDYDAQLPEVQPHIINSMTAYDPQPEPRWMYVLKLAVMLLVASLCFGLSAWFFSWGAR